MNSIDDIFQHLKDINFDTRNQPKTKYIKLGEIVYPLTTFNNGLTLLEYPIGFYEGLYEKHKTNIT